MRSEKTFLSICAAAFALSCTSPLFAAEPSDPPPPPPQPSEASPGEILPPPPTTAGHPAGRRSGDSRSSIGKTWQRCAAQP